MKTKPTHLIRSKIKFSTTILSLVAAPLSCWAASATDLFEIRVADDPVFGRGFAVGDHSIIRLVDHLINSSDEFRSLSTRPRFDASATYFGVPDALGFDLSEDATGVSALLTSSLTGLSKSFVGPTRSDVEHQIEEWLKKNGASELAKLDSEISKRSAAAPNDGNPFATTATLATDSFGRFGLGTSHRDPKANGIAGAADELQLAFGLGAGLSYSTATIETPAGKLNASRLDLPIEFGFPLGATPLRLEVAIPLNITEMERNYIYGAGLNLGLPWRVLSIGDGSRWGWQLTPMGGVMGRVDVEGANGALVYYAGAASMLEYEITQGLTIAMGNQIGTFHDIGIEIGGVDIQRDIDQRIVNNGIRLSKDIGGWTLEGYVVDSRFLEEAAVDGFQTYGAHVVYNFSKSFYLGTAVDYINSSQFEAVRVSLGSSFRF